MKYVDDDDDTVMFISTKYHSNQNVLAPFINVYDKMCKTVRIMFTATAVFKHSAPLP